MSEVAENSVDKRDSILQGAFDEFCENGFLAASMDRISKRAGASKRTVYRYFESKEVIDLIKRDCQFLAQTKETFWEYTDRGDKNIYYTPYKKHLKDFYKTFLSQFIQSVYDRGENKVKASKFVSL